MHLWTEYEGRTIAESYTLGRLLRSEGRNGFFATADKDGHPAVIRLTEAHFDEAEQLARWRQVAEVHQRNLIEIEQVGQTTFEGVKLTYALMEPEDANLGDVLKERPLTPAETLQVAKSVLPALMALHERGLVHEHIRPENVLAVGETVKLRSDCVRECVVDGEFTTPEACDELRRRDTQDYGRLLLLCLTLEGDPAQALSLPEPFRRVVPAAMDGSWTLERIGMALDPVLFAPKPPAQATVAGAGAGLGSGTVPLPVRSAGALDPSGATSEASRPLVPPEVLLGGRADTREQADEPALPLRHSSDTETSAVTPVSRGLLVIVPAVVLIVLALWYFFGGHSGRQAASPAPAAVPQGSPATPRPERAVEPALPTPHTAAVAGQHTGWYVIAFTYNHEEQARHKVQQLRRTHNSMHPQVFTPTGRAPFFVSLGGPMSQAEAESTFRHAHRSGLPRDTFVRHY